MKENRKAQVISKALINDDPYLNLAIAVVERAYLDLVEALVWKRAYETELENAKAQKEINRARKLLATEYRGEKRVGIERPAGCSNEEDYIGCKLVTKYKLLSGRISACEHFFRSDRFHLFTQTAEGTWFIRMAKKTCDEFFEGKRKTWHLQYTKDSKEILEDDYVLLQ